jgi:hypothetical protein
MQELPKAEQGRAVRAHREPLLHEAHVDHGVAHKGLRLSLPVPWRVLVVCPNTMQHFGNVIRTKQKQEKSTQVTHALQQTRATHSMTIRCCKVQFPESISFAM